MLSLAMHEKRTVINAKVILASSIKFTFQVLDSLVSSLHMTFFVFCSFISVDNQNKTLELLFIDEFQAISSHYLSFLDCMSLIKWCTYIFFINTSSYFIIKLLDISINTYREEKYHT